MSEGDESGADVVRCQDWNCSCREPSPPRLRAPQRSADSAKALPRRDRASCDYEPYVPDLVTALPVRLDGNVAADVADARIVRDLMDDLFRRTARQAQR